MKRTSIIALLIAASASTQSIASNACLVDGRTVFQKEPCVAQEAKNLTGDMRDHRKRKQAKQKAVVRNNQIREEDYARMLRQYNAAYNASPEGIAEKRMKRMERATIINRANAQAGRSRMESQLRGINSKLNAAAFDRSLRAWD